MVAGSTFIIQKIYHFFLVVKLKCGVALACLSGQNLVHFFLNHSKLLDRAMIIWYIVIKKYKTIGLDRKYLVRICRLLKKNPRPCTF